MKRRYTMDQYRADVAKLWVPKSDAPVKDEALAEALADGVELLPAEETPTDTAIQSQPPPPPQPQGGFVRRWSGLRQKVRGEATAPKAKQRQG
jgi:hypothetical protein